MKKLSILISQFNETDIQFLDSIKIQQSINFKDIEVIIRNGGSNIFLENIHDYPFDIQYVKSKEKETISKTRNELLKLAKGEYVMFCDADDMFGINYALWIIFREMKDNVDAIISPFIEECKNTNDEYVYIKRGQKDVDGIDGTFVHGKIYRRKYLINKKILWNNDLDIHEDSYFNCLAIKCAEKAVYCDTPFYIWKYNKNSISRNDPEFILKTYDKLINSNEAMVLQFLKRGMENVAKEYICSMVYGTYYKMNLEEWLNEKNKEHRERVEGRFKKYFLKFQDLFRNTDYKTKSNWVNIARERARKEGLILEQISFPYWLNGLLNG